MDAAPTGLTEAISARYRVLDCIGEGGAATVFLADDLKHGRKVALKLLNPEVSASMGTGRFVREIAIAAKLNHPHILPLIDSGDAGGFLFYVMPYVDGGSLRDRLADRGALPLAEACHIVEQVAGALTYAHERGIVHRDVKPENILFSGGQVVLADFGIARAVETASHGPLTTAGLAIGTPAYMSPEQAFGEATLDGRSDVYSLGCVLHEMLAGKPPFGGRSPQAVLAKHATDTAAPLRTIVPALPLYVERAVQRALAKDPAARFATPSALADTLRSETLVAPTGRRRVAVLPPVILASEPQAHLALGLHEAMISRLGECNVAVLARTSVLAYTGTASTIREIAGELGVDVVVESSIFHDAQRVGVRARIVDGSTQEALWSGTEDGAPDQLFGLYRALADSMAAQLGKPVSSSMFPATRQPVDVAAYENYMRGRAYQEHFTPSDLETALRYYEAALRTAPDFAPAHAGIALVWGSRVVMGLLPPLEGGPRWREAAERAVSLDPQSAEGHQALGQAYAFHDWDWSRAEAAFERAVLLNPSEPMTHTMYSHLLAAMSRPDEAARHGRRALELDPSNPFHHAMFGMVLMFAGRYQDAVAHLRQSLRMLPTNVLAQLGLGGCHLALGDAPRALEHHATVFQIFGDTEIADALRAGARSGEVHAGFRRAGEIFEARSRGSFVKPVHVVIMFDAAGDLDRAFAWADRAYELRDHDLAYFAVAPWSAAFRRDARFDRMLRRVGLPVLEGERESPAFNGPAGDDQERVPS